METDKYTRIIGFLCVTMMGVFGLFMLYSLYQQDVSNMETVENNETNITQPTFQQVYVYCNNNLQNYTLSNPNYLYCETQDQCDLKELRLNVLQEQAFGCMKSFWELK